MTHGVEVRAVARNLPRSITRGKQKCWGEEDTVYTVGIYTYQQVWERTNTPYLQS